MFSSSGSRLNIAGTLLEGIFRLTVRLPAGPGWERDHLRGRTLGAYRLPPNMLTESEKEELQKGLKESEIWDDVSPDDGSTDFISSPINLYSLADAWYQQFREWQYSLFDRLIGGAVLLDELRRYKLSDFFPADQPWILRNPTTQEYVRSEAIAIKPEILMAPTLTFWALAKSSGHVFADLRKQTARWITQIMYTAAYGLGTVSI